MTLVYYKKHPNYSQESIVAYIYPFPSQLPSSSADLPVTLMSLEDWSLVNVEGEDARKYLQGQLTCDVDTLTASDYTFAAHCDPKGKVWSNLALFCQNDELAYIERTSLCDAQLAELKKYAVFSKVTIKKNDEQVLLGLAGHHARETLALIYQDLPDSQTSVVQHKHATLLHVAAPTERFLIVATQDEAEMIFTQLLGKVALNNSAQWQALDIEAGYPILDTQNSGQFLPQSLNLQALNAISFTKGCYSGQEMVARAKYRGANKYAMYWLSGKSSFSLPTVGDKLELQLGENWRQTGTILTAVKLADDTVWVQAILSNDLAEDAVLRLKDNDDTLAIQSLPYSLTE